LFHRQPGETLVVADDGVVKSTPISMGGTPAMSNDGRGDFSGFQIIDGLLSIQE